MEQVKAMIKYRSTRHPLDISNQIDSNELTSAWRCGCFFEFEKNNEENSDQFGYCQDLCVLQRAKKSRDWSQDFGGLIHLFRNISCITNRNDSRNIEYLMSEIKIFFHEMGLWFAEDIDIESIDESMLKPISQDSGIWLCLHGEETNVWMWHDYLHMVIEWYKSRIIQIDELSGTKSF